MVRRIGGNESEISYLRDDLSEFNRLTSSMESQLHIFSAQLKTLTERKDPWHNIITAVGVMVTIGILALTPVGWLAVTNYQRHNAYSPESIERGKLIGKITASAKYNEKAIDKLDARNDRVEDRLNGHIDRAEVHK